ncbi:MAG: adenylate kinase [Paludibacteraceae bacterium]
MLNIVIFGAPGSGKGTQSELIVKKYNLVHLSTGDMLRDEIARGTDIGKFADALISKGNLVPDDLIIKMISAKIDERKEDCNGFIFDGFPRTVAQAEALDALLASFGKKLTLMLDLRVEESLLVERLLKRGETSHRADDNLEVIKKRLQVYHEITMPVIEFYKSTGRYVAVENCTTIEEYFQAIVQLIEFSICGF